MNPNVKKWIKNDGTKEMQIETETETETEKHIKRVRVDEFGIMHELCQIQRIELWAAQIWVNGKHWGIIINDCSIENDAINTVPSLLRR